MTTFTYSLSAKPAPSRQGLGNLVRAEATKLRSLRSTTWALLVTAVGALLVTGLSAHHVATRNNHDFSGFDPTNMALVGLALASLSLGVLGVLAVSGEYGTGTMRSSLSAAPRRIKLTVSKVMVVGLLSLLVGEILAFGSFFLGMGIISGTGAPTASLGQPDALRAVILSGAFLSLLALFALGLGFIIRHTAGAIAAFVGCTLLLPVLLQGISENLARYAPANIFANSVTTAIPYQGNHLSPLSGFVLMAVYTVVVLGAGMVLFVRRDA